ncbi:MAG: cyclic nucleotide-binding domain-containing protein [Anaerolineae bacterium]|nr:cyclic nucleotide-binding domain-containing protein [Anaerolineae bacterium]
MDEIVKFLFNVPLFKALNRRQLELLAKRVVNREYAGGATIVTQGKGGEGFFIVFSGKVDVVRERADGSKSIVNQLAGGDFFGELALLDDGPRTATCVAVDPTVCLVLPRWDFLAVLKEEPEMAVMILEEMAKRFRAALDVL